LSNSARYSSVTLPMTFGYSKSSILSAAYDVSENAMSSVESKSAT
jgi:hypothetical protein